MAERPIIFAMANPDPEIKYELAKEARPDAIVATGRSDYPNQVNNVLGFPFIFRGALDVGATCINEEMKIACVEALSALAEAESQTRQAATEATAAVLRNSRLFIVRPLAWVVCIRDSGAAS